MDLLDQVRWLAFLVAMVGIAHCYKKDNSWHKYYDWIKVSLIVFAITDVICICNGKG